MRQALILIDFQKEWIDSKSGDFVGDISGVLERTNKLIGLCRNKNYKIIFTRHVEKDSTDAWSDSSAGTEIIDAMDRKPGDIVITKNKISPFFKTTLENELNEIDEVVVCGILTNMCVRSTVHDAYDRGLKVFVIKDCCVAFDKKTQDFTFQDLKATRPEVQFIDVIEFE